MHDCPCIYCKEIAEATKEQYLNTRLAKLEKEAMQRLLNPVEVEECVYPDCSAGDPCPVCDGEEFDEEYCWCGEELGCSSHYHCGNCGRECSMMGHDECDPMAVWEWNLVKDLYDC